MKEKTKVYRLLDDMEVIYLNQEPSLIIGSAFQSDIFYQYRQMVPLKYGCFYYLSHDLFFSKLDDDEGQTSDSLMKKGKQIKYGEIIQIHDLWIMYLGKIMILKADQGSLRVAYRERRS